MLKPIKKKTFCKKKTKQSGKMSEFISKKVITNSVASNHSGGGGGGDLWLLNTTFVALDTIGSVCQSGMKHGQGISPTPPFSSLFS